MDQLITGRVKLQIIFILLLCFITAYIFDDFNRYEYTGAELIDNPLFSDDFIGWEKSGLVDDISIEQEAILRLGDLHRKSTVTVKQYIKPLPNQRSYMLSVDVKSNGVIQGYERWQKAHVVVAGVDSSSRAVYEDSHFLLSLVGDNDWQSYKKIIHNDGSTQRYLVSVQISSTKGVLKVRELSLRPVTEKKIYKIYWLLLVFLWSSLIIWIAYGYFLYYETNKRSYIDILMFGFFSIILLMPQGLTHDAISRFLFVFSWGQKAHDLLLGSGIMDKLAHIVVFLLLSLRLFWSKKITGELVGRVFLLFLLAVVSEVLQLLTSDRNLEIQDLAADSIGIIAALVLWILIYSLRKNKCRFVSMFSG